MKRFAIFGFLLLAMAGLAYAMQDATPAEGVTETAKGLDLNLLWKGAIMGCIAAVLRFISKAKNPKEFDFKYLLLYGAVGVVGGAYAAWRGLEFDNVFAWLEGSGIIMALWMILKGGKEGIPKAIGMLKLFGKKGDADPPAPSEPSNPSS